MTTATEPLTAEDADLAELRADRDHLLRTARQAATAAARERELRERLSNRLAAVDRYIATARISGRTRVELTALLTGFREQD